MNGGKEVLLSQNYASHLDEDNELCECTITGFAMTLSITSTKAESVLQ